MRTQEASCLLSGELDTVSEVVQEFEEAWRGGPPLLERFRARFDAEESGYGLAELVKADLHNRYRRGERPDAREYLDRFPELACENGQALSLIYEEYCLRVEADEDVDTSEFCDRYPTWRDSLASQLAYHRKLSQAVEPAASGPEFPLPGTRFCEYMLERVLGSGGVAKVFLARATNLGWKPYALKISPNKGGEPEILGKLDHPNIVPVHSMAVDQTSGLRGLCMPYRPGLPLDQVIRRLRQEKTPPKRAQALRTLVEVDASADGDEKIAAGWSDFPASGSYGDAVAWLGLKMARALAHAHAIGFFHRDVKPENILLTGREGPQLLDFNLAHAPELVDQALAAHKGGTLPYMAPEHLQAFLDPSQWPSVRGAADIYSLGLVLRELLTLQSPTRPPAGLPLPRAVNAMLTSRAARATPIRARQRDVSHALDAILVKCLEPAAEDRYANASALAEDLSRYLERRPLRHTPNPSVVEVTLNAVRRRRTAIAAGGGIFLVAVAIPVLVSWLAGLDPAPSRQTVDKILQIVKDDEAAGEPLTTQNYTLPALRQVTRTKGDSIPAIRQILKDHPHSTALRLALGEAALTAKPARLALAEQAFSEVSRDHPQEVAALTGMATVAHQKKDHRAAIDWLTRAADVCELEAAAPANRNRLPALWIARVRELIALGDEANDDKRFVEADRFFERALGDLNSIYREDLGELNHLRDTAEKKEFGPELVRRRFAREVFSGLATLGRARAADGLHHREESLRYFERAYALGVGARKSAKELKLDLDQEYSASIDRLIEKSDQGRRKWLSRH